MDIFYFCRWWWNRYFDHIKEIELIAAKNWRELCLTKIKEMDKRLMDNGITIIFLCLLLTGCATMQYKAPDGTEINYTRLATTSDSIRAEVGNATVESNGQKIDAKILQAITEFLKAVQ